MKKTLSALILTLFSISGFSQIYEPEGLNMPGSWNAWVNPPTNLALASSGQVAGGRVARIATGVARYQTYFSVAASGADLIGGTYDWLFTSGSPSNYWANKWGNVTVTMNTLQSYTWNSGAGNNNVTLTNGKWYTMNWKDIGYVNTSAIFMETSAAPVDISVVAQSPLAANVYPGQSVTVNITSSALLSAEEKIYVRYSTNDFSTSALAEASFTGTSGVATIPALTGTVKYYVFSTTISNPASDYDLLTIKLNNNSGSNYSYTVNSSWTTAADGNWSSTSTWQGGVVPVSGQPITIAHDVSLDQNTTVSSVTINTGKTLTINSGNKLQTGGGVTVTGALTVNGSLQINSGGYVATNAPAYSNGSTLIYNTGATYGRNLEWSATSGNGYPWNVQISNNTTFDLGANGGTGIARQCGGNSTVDAGSTFTMNGSGNVMLFPLTVMGNIANSGTITLSGSIGGDLITQGNIVDNGTFNANNRAVFFNGSNVQDISGSGTFDISYIRINKSGGRVKLLSNLVCAGPNGGNALEIEGASSILDLNGFTLTLGQAGVSSTYNNLIAIPGSIRGSSSSNLTVLGTGALGTINFDQTTPGTTDVLLNLSLDRTLTGSMNIGNTLTVGGTLTITNGSLIIPAQKQLTVNGTLTNSPGITGLIIKSDASGTGSLKHTTANVDATFERFLNDADWTDWKDGWHFLSSPVASQAISPNFTVDPVPTGQYDFYCWYEPENIWVNFKNTTTPPTWITANGSTNFTVGKGYMAAYDAADTKIFSGKLNVADVPVSGLTISGGDNKSWHLLGNPFACALSWDESIDWSRSNISGVAKIWNESSQSYSDLSSDPASVIPATNGFMVQVVTAPGSLTLPASKRTHSAQAFYKSTYPFLKLMARNTTAGNAQESSVCFIPDATAGFDLMYDGEFLEGYAPLFYSVAGSEHFSTNALSASVGIVEIPFDFIKNEGDNFSIEAEAISDIYGPVILNDLKTGISQDLTVNPVYVFTSAPEDNPSRFLLTFGHVGMDQNIKNYPFTVYASGNTLVVTDKTGKNQGNIFVYNLTGQLIASDKLNGCSAYNLSMNVPSGYYLVKVVSPETTQSSKVFIQ